jgi:hypothetical protein
MRGPVFMTPYYHLGFVGSPANTSTAIEANFPKPTQLAAGRATLLGYRPASAVA